MRVSENLGVIRILLCRVLHSSPIFSETPIWVAAVVGSRRSLHDEVTATGRCKNDMFGFRVKGLGLGHAFISPEPRGDAGTGALELQYTSYSLRQGNL